MSRSVGADQGAACRRGCRAWAPDGDDRGRGVQTRSNGRRLVPGRRLRCGRPLTRAVRPHRAWAGARGLDPARGHDRFRSRAGGVAAVLPQRRSGSGRSACGPPGASPWALPSIAGVANGGAVSGPRRSARVGCAGSWRRPRIWRSVEGRCRGGDASQRPSGPGSAARAQGACRWCRLDGAAAPRVPRTTASSSRRTDPCSGHGFRWRAGAPWSCWLPARRSGGTR